MNLHSFAYGTAINRQQVPLTLDQLQRMAPSAFATQPHESRSNRYTYIPTAQIIEAMTKEGFQPFKATQSLCRVPGKENFTKHMIRFRHADHQLQKVGDVVPEIVLVNSHDGTSAYKLLAALFRLACSNGLVVADSTLESISVMHKGNIADNVIEGSYKIIEDTPKVIDRVADWNRLQLTTGEAGAFAEAAHTLRFGDSEGEAQTPITAAQLLTPRRQDDNKADLWTTFNRVQENAIKGGLTGTKRDERGRRIRRVTTREVRGIDQDVKLNRALWQLAERMSELKTGKAA